MRDKNFVAEHRGGLLLKKNHEQLMEWSCLCAEHMLRTFKVDNESLFNILSSGRKWTKGEIRTGEAMKASVQAHAIARSYSDPVLTAIARSVGHAVATAHMADHSLGAAIYALKAVKLSGQGVEEERKWQNEQLPPEIKDIVISSRPVKEKAFGLVPPGIEFA